MTTLYGVNKATLEAYVRAERAKVYQAVVEKMNFLTSIKDGDNDEDWWVLYNWCQKQSAKETQ